MRESTFTKCTRVFQCLFGTPISGLRALPNKLGESSNHSCSSLRYLCAASEVQHRLYGFSASEAAATSVSRDERGAGEAETRGAIDQIKRWFFFVPEHSRRPIKNRLGAKIHELMVTSQVEESFFRRQDKGRMHSIEENV